MKTRPEPARRRQAWPRTLGLLLGAGLWLAAAAPARALELDELMNLLSQTRGGQARFTEERQVKGLDAPLTSSGLLSFAAPDRFTRQTLQPRPETLAVQGKIITISRSGRTRSLVLDAIPEMEAIVEAVRGTLTGNGATLRQHFRTTVSGQPELWTLELVPLEPRLQVMLSQVRISGRRAELRSVEMRMADGDRSVMQVEPLAGAKAP
ncbi:outer membrane lipoprotein carrier protein LolA [Aquabacterium sp. OR-4]|uniref:outer membrane lipoprotein carrier protein LolA n=1 Tax=Aquabacterium sp. OR-4 TaxID=2978127 RepID=UPI0021B159E0|nr:outer membrane lipoprotein carrier protein LolA [Aquabacterium sp. OR-4]MDT7836742.1 outer membrane lipoprotein carrier protein LolA [Aquabacterium sp. OR-4]